MAKRAFCCRYESKGTGHRGQGWSETFPEKGEGGSFFFFLWGFWRL